MTQPAERNWPDLAGRIEGKRHILPVRVYFEDTDFSGFVYHTGYLRWCERGRSDLLRLLGVHHSELAEPGEGKPPSAFVLRHMEVDYLRPARIDDVLEVTTELAEIGRVHLTLAQAVMRGEEILCRVRVKAVLVSLEGRPLRLPQQLTDRLKRE